MAAGVVGTKAVALLAQKLNMAPEWLFERVCFFGAK
jgi:hypothetical protein